MANSANYSLWDYISYMDYRRDMRGGGVLMLINPRLKPVLISQKQSATDAYNINAIKLLGTESSASVVAIYRAP